MDLELAKHYQSIAMKRAHVLAGAQHINKSNLLTAYDEIARQVLTDDGQMQRWPSGVVLFGEVLTAFRAENKRQLTKSKRKTSKRRVRAIPHSDAKAPEVFNTSAFSSSQADLLPEETLIRLRKLGEQPKVRTYSISCVVDAYCDNAMFFEQAILEVIAGFGHVGSIVSIEIKRT